MAAPVLAIYTDADLTFSGLIKDGAGNAVDIAEFTKSGAIRHGGGTEIITSYVTIGAGTGTFSVAVPMSVTDNCSEGKASVHLVFGAGSARNYKITVKAEVFIGYAP